MLSAAVLSASVANAAIVIGSQLQLGGGANISDAAGGYTITPSGTQFVVPSGNTQSFLGFNTPNPLGIYSFTMTPISTALVPVLPWFTLPPVVIGGGEPGPAAPQVSFSVLTWQVTMANIGGVFSAVGSGYFLDSSDKSMTDAVIQFTSQAYTPGSDTQSWSATITTIPVPGAMWIFGSGLLLMATVMRRRSV